MLAIARVFFLDTLFGVTATGSQERNTATILTPAACLVGMCHPLGRNSSHDGVSVGFPEGYTSVVLEKIGAPKDRPHSFGSVGALVS